MTHLDPCRQVRVFHLTEITHVHTTPQVRSFAQVAERTHPNLVFYYRAFNHRRQQVAVIANCGVIDEGVRSNFAAFADDGAAAKPGVGQQNGVSTNFHAFFYINKFRVSHAYAGEHMRLIDASADDALGFRQVHAVVDAKGFFLVCHCKAGNRRTFCHSHGYDVREVIFTLR